MKYLLDTCVISELVKSEPYQRLTEWIASTPSDDVFLSVITIGEIRKGIVKLPDSKKKAQLTVWLNTLLEEYQDRILPVDLAVIDAWGQMQGAAEQAGTPMSSFDSLIAATVLVHRLTLVTRNERDFLPGDIPLINPWTW